MTSAAVHSGTSSCWAARRRSRIARPPVRSTPGGSTPQISQSSSTARTKLKACPAAVRAARPARRVVPSSGGGTGDRSRWRRSSRSTSPTSRGSVTVSSPIAPSRPRASNCSMGDWAVSTETSRRALGTRPDGGPQASSSSAALACGPTWPISFRTAPGSASRTATGWSWRNTWAAGCPSPAGGSSASFTPGASIALVVDQRHLGQHGQGFR